LSDGDYDDNAAEGADEIALNPLDNARNLFDRTNEKKGRGR